MLRVPEDREAEKPSHRTPWELKVESTQADASSIIINPSNAPSIAWTATNTTTAKPMSRIPASLLYLTVYNPTLKPTGPIPDGDEDAEEQAQILFYTSKERAVSRDRMLRQVGLAKALVNFTECVFWDKEWVGKA